MKKEMTGGKMKSHMGKAMGTKKTMGFAKLGKGKMGKASMDSPAACKK